MNKDRKTVERERDYTLPVFIIILVFALVSSFLAGSVEGEGVKEGVILDKTYQYAHIKMFHTIVPPQFQLQIEGYNESDRKVRCWVECSEEEYKQYNIGDYYAPKEIINYTLNKEE